MLDKLLLLDRQAFIAINNGLASSFLDAVCPWLRTQEFWYPLYMVLLVFIILKYRKESWKILLAVLLMLIATDQFSANLVKNTFMRIRPCAEPTLEGITRHLISSCNGYSFMSAHATNHFALAVFVPYYFREYKWILPTGLVWALLISLSQVYVGVHYPLDILAGGFSGVVFGMAFSRYTHKYIKLPA